jgi:hypothetical protein
VEGECKDFMNGTDSISGNGKGYTLLNEYLSGVSSKKEKFKIIMSCIMVLFTPIRLIATGETKAKTKGNAWKVGSSKYLPKLDEDNFKLMASDEKYNASWDKGGAAMPFSEYRAKLGEYSRVNLTMCTRIALCYLQHCDTSIPQPSLVKEYFNRFTVKPFDLSRAMIETDPNMKPKTKEIFEEDLNSFRKSRKHWDTPEFATLFRFR